jgi:hypothetical protein
MDSKLVKEWASKGLSPSKDFEYFTRRENIVIGKLMNQDAQVEYKCEKCGHCGITTISMEKNKSGKKFLRPSFKCEKCGITIDVPDLKKK